MKEQKALKPYLQKHDTGEEAVARTTKNNVMAVVVKTYAQDTLHSTEFYSFKTHCDGSNFNGELTEAFPMALGSNQSIEEIDANDF